MNEKLKAFFEAKNAERKMEKEKTLIDLGLFEKVYSTSDEAIEEFPFIEWDSENSVNVYFKKVPIEVSDEEYEEIKKYAKDSKNTDKKDNIIASILKKIAWCVFIVGAIAGLALGNLGYRGFSFGITLIYWFASFISGITLLGFAEIIQLLTDIKNK